MHLFLIGKKVKGIQVRNEGPENAKEHQQGGDESSSVDAAEPEKKCMQNANDALKDRQMRAATECNQEEKECLTLQHPVPLPDSSEYREFCLKNEQFAASIETRVFQKNMILYKQAYGK
eukprot:5927908-Ditylum_brightwellii.AAC.1